MSSNAMTETVGYYNGNKWPIDLGISELNVTLRLQSGEYIKDAAGRKINDSFFDKYTRPLQLAKEVSKNGPVDLIVVPRVTSANTNAGHQHSVRSVTKFTQDAYGHKVPVMPAPVAAPNILVNTPSHKGMSVEEARRLGLIGKPREVSEDYGIADTSGRPVDVSQAPPIRYAMESTPRIRQAESLPSELTKMDEKIDPGQQAARAHLVTGLSKAASSSVVESPTGFMNEATIMQQPQIAAPQLIIPPEPPADESLPAPNIFSPGQIANTPDPLAEARAAASKPAAPAPPAAPLKPAAPKNAKPFVCALDKQAFKYRSELEKYAKRKFPEKVEEILAPYPAT